MTVVFEWIPHITYAHTRVNFASASRCIDRHRESNFFERSTLAILGAVAIVLRVEKETDAKSYWKGISRYFDPLRWGEESAYIAATNRGIGKRDRVFLFGRFIRQVMLFLYSLAAFVCILRRGSKMKRIPLAPQILSLFLSLTEFSPSESILSR